MEEIEVPTEHLHEDIQEHAEHSRERWIMMVALTAALLAVLAAVSALLAGHHSNEATIDQIKASDQWAYYQAKGIKSAVLESKTELLREMGKSVSEKDVEKLKTYKEEQKEIDKEARELQHSSERHLVLHHGIAQSVTIFQISIAICAIAVLTRKKQLWYGSIFLGIVGAALWIITLM
jgi:hypothetical protein